MIAAASTDFWAFVPHPEVWLLVGSLVGLYTYAGRVIETASARELYANPRHPYTLGLLKSVPRLDQVRKEKLDPIEGMPPDLVHMDAGCPFRPRCRFAVDRCEEENPPLVSVAEAHQAACWEWQRVGKAPVETAA